MIKNYTIQINKKYAIIMSIKRTKERVKVHMNNNDMINMIRQGFNDINKRFNAMDARLDKVENRLDQMDARFDNIENRLDQMDTRLDRIEHRLDNVEERLENIEKDVSYLSRNIGEHALLLNRLVN